MIIRCTLGAHCYDKCEYASTHIETHFWSHLCQILMDFGSIWVLLKVIKIGPNSPKKPEKPESLAQTVTAIAPSSIGANLLSVYCQPSLLSWEEEREREREREPFQAGQGRAARTQGRALWVA